jgi:transcriptional regulator with XRE-family HTH domain
MELNERIKQIRKIKKDTQQNLADKIGLKQGTIAQFERGTAKPSERTIEDICRVYNVNKEWLISGTGEITIERTKKDELKEQIHKIIDKLDNEEIAILQKIAEKIKGM